MHRIHSTTTKFEANNSRLEHAKFDHVHMDRSDFVDCGLQSSDFRSCDLTGAVFSQCDFTGTTIDGILVEDLFAAYNSLKRRSSSDRELS